MLFSLQGLAMLRKTGWLPDVSCITAQNAASKLCKWACQILIPPSASRRSAPIAPAVLEFARTALQVAVELNEDVMLLYLKYFIGLMGILSYR